MKRWHGVADLIEAVRRLGPSAPVHLVIAGTGPESDEIHRLVKAATIDDRVHLVGQLAHDQVPSLLGAIDIGVAPYTPAADFYFSPLKVLEYLAAGLQWCARLWEICPRWPATPVSTTRPAISTVSRRPAHPRRATRASPPGRRRRPLPGRALELGRQCRGL